MTHHSATADSILHGLEYGREEEAAAGKLLKRVIGSMNEALGLMPKSENVPGIADKVHTFGERMHEVGARYARDFERMFPDIAQRAREFLKPYEAVMTRPVSNGDVTAVSETMQKMSVAMETDDIQSLINGTMMSAANTHSHEGNEHPDAREDAEAPGESPEDPDDQKEEKPKEKLKNRKRVVKSAWLKPWGEERQHLRSVMRRMYERMRKEKKQIPKVPFYARLTLSGTLGKIALGMGVAVSGLADHFFMFKLPGIHGLMQGGPLAVATGIYIAFQCSAWLQSTVMSHKRRLRDYLGAADNKGSEALAMNVENEHAAPIFGPVNRYTLVMPAVAIIGSLLTVAKIAKAKFMKEPTPDFFEDVSERAIRAGNVEMAPATANMVGRAARLTSAFTTALGLGVLAYVLGDMQADMDKRAEQRKGDAVGAARQITDTAREKALAAIESMVAEAARDGDVTYDGRGAGWRAANEAKPGLEKMVIEKLKPEAVLDAPVGWTPWGYSLLAGMRLEELIDHAAKAELLFAANTDKRATGIFARGTHKVIRRGVGSAVINTEQDVEAAITDVQKQILLKTSEESEVPGRIARTPGLENQGRKLVAYKDALGQWRFRYSKNNPDVPAGKRGKEYEVRPAYKAEGKVQPQMEFHAPEWNEAATTIPETVDVFFKLAGGTMALVLLLVALGENPEILYTRNVIHKFSMTFVMKLLYGIRNYFRKKRKLKPIKYVYSPEKGPLNRLIRSAGARIHTPASAGFLVQDNETLTTLDRLGVEEATIIPMHDLCMEAARETMRELANDEKLGIKLSDEVLNQVMVRFGEMFEEHLARSTDEHKLMQPLRGRATRINLAAVNALEKLSRRGALRTITGRGGTEWKIISQVMDPRMLIQVARLFRTHAPEQMENAMEIALAMRWNGWGRSGITGEMRRMLRETPPEKIEEALEKLRPEDGYPVEIGEPDKYFSERMAPGDFNHGDGKEPEGPGEPGVVDHFREAIKKRTGDLKDKTAKASAVVKGKAVNAAEGLKQKATSRAHDFIQRYVEPNELEDKDGARGQEPNQEPAAGEAVVQPSPSDRPTKSDPKTDLGPIGVTETEKRDLIAQLRSIDEWYRSWEPHNQGHAKYEEIKQKMENGVWPMTQRIDETAPDQIYGQSWQASIDDIAATIGVLVQSKNNKQTDKVHVESASPEPSERPVRKGDVKLPPVVVRSPSEPVVKSQRLEVDEVERDKIIDDLETLLDLLGSFDVKHAQEMRADMEETIAQPAMEGKLAPARKRLEEYRQAIQKKLDEAKQSTGSRPTDDDNVEPGAIDLESERQEAMRLISAAHILLVKKGMDQSRKAQLDPNWGQPYTAMIREARSSQEIDKATEFLKQMLKASGVNLTELYRAAEELL